MNWRTTLLCIVILGIACTITAQEKWSLEKCIDYAQTNSLNIKQAELAVKQAQLSERGFKFSRYPNLNATIGGGVQFGLATNPTTNILENQTSGSNNFSISSGLLLYNGNRIKNSIKQSQIDIKAAQANVQQSSYNIALDVAGAYLNILFAEEQLDAAKKRLTQTQANLRQTDKLIQAGTLPENDRLEILARIATNEQAIVAQENQVASSYLLLKQLLILDPGFELAIEKPQIEVPNNISAEAFDLEQIYSQSLSTQPQIKAGELNLQSAEVGVDIAKSGLYPRVTLFGNIDTRYFSKAKDFNKPNETNKRVELGNPIPVEINGEPANFAVFREVGVTYPNQKYFSQLREFLGQSVGVNISIPIYNNQQTKIAMERAQLNILTTQIQNKQIKQQLKSAVQRAIADVRATKKTLDAAQKTVESLRIAYRNTEKRYDLGAVNTFELTTAKSNLDTAEVDLIIAKYDYLYRLKIVDFYQGNKISLR